MYTSPWPVWLSWFEHCLIIESFWVQFPVRVKIWVLSLIPGPDVYNPWSRSTWEATN